MIDLDCEKGQFHSSSMNSNESSHRPAHKTVICRLQCDSLFYFMISQANIRRKNARGGGKLATNMNKTNRFMLFFVPGFVPARDVDVDRERETNFVRQFTDGWWTVDFKFKGVKAKTIIDNYFYIHIFHENRQT